MSLERRPAKSRLIGSVFNGYNLFIAWPIIMGLIAGFTCDPRHNTPPTPTPTIIITPSTQQEPILTPTPNL